jgi:excisionase family DNA binding protein
MPATRPAVYDTWLSTQDVARALGVSPGFVRARIVEGTLPATAIEARRLIYRIRRSDFEAWRRAHTGPATGTQFQR